jgi:predicted outer membrane repeat protein
VIDKALIIEAPVPAGNAVLRNLSIDHSLVANNEAREVSGGGSYAANAADLTVVNSTVSGNTTPQDGGGILAGEDISIRNSTIAHNAAARGGVFMASGRLTLRNSIVADNASSDAGTENCFIGATVQTVLAGRNISNDVTWALAALGSPTEARAAADRAVVALANGYGPANQHTRRARAFRDSLP